MDSWNSNQNNNNQEPDVSVSGQFSGNPYQDQNTAGSYSQQQDTADSYGQSQDTTNHYGQQNVSDPYGQTQNAAGGYNQPQNTAGGYHQQGNQAGNSYQAQNTAGAYGYNQQGQNNYAYGQPYANYNQSPYQGSGFIPTEMEEPVGVGEWTGLLALATFVPCIGVILMLVWAFGSTEKKSKSNFCKAFLIIWLIKLALSAIMFIIWGASIATMISEF